MLEDGKIIVGLQQNTLSKDSTLYVGALEVESSIREKYYFANGFMEIMVGSLNTYNYYNTDHLGNVRHVSRSPLAGSTSIIQVNNYYPFGGLLKEGEHHWDIQNRFYNGKEYDRMQGLNLYDYSARQYDPAVCQFTSIDPLCEKSYNVSPYVYCHSNPVKRIDPDGKDDFELQKNGQLILRNVGGKIDNIYYGKNSFSIAHGAFGKTTKNMIGKDFSGRNANFSNVKDGLKFMRTVSKYTEKELSGVGISYKDGNFVKRLEVSAWNKNGLGRNAKGGISNIAYGTYTISSKERVKYAIHTHPQVSGIPDSGTSKASDQDRNDMLNFPDGTMHFITTPSDNQTYIIKRFYDGTTEKLSREEGVLY